MYVLFEEGTYREVQASLWPKEDIELLEKKNIHLL